MERKKRRKLLFYAGGAVLLAGTALAIYLVAAPYAEQTPPAASERPHPWEAMQQPPDEGSATDEPDEDERWQNSAPRERD